MMLVCSRMLVSRRAWRSVVVGSALSAVALAPQGPATAADAAAGVTTRVSVSSTGAQGNNTSASLAISPDGRYIAFESDATNLVPGDTNQTRDMFVRDRQAGTTSRVSVSGTGAEANGHSFGPAISADGRYVAFTSNAFNLVPGDTSDGEFGGNDVFVRDLLAGTTRRVSVSGSGGPTNAGSSSQGAAISADGRYIAFSSDARNIVPGDTNRVFDVFLRDVQAGTTRRVSVSGTGAQANRHSAWPAISADGRHVAFETAATTLVPSDTNRVSDVFLRDVRAGTTRRVSVSSTGGQANNDGDSEGSTGSHNPAISANGRYVTFASYGSNLVPGDTNAMSDGFLRDVRTGITRRVSVSSTGGQGNGPSYVTGISSDGRYVAVGSAASNLVSGDTNAHRDVFVRDWVAGTTHRVTVSSTGAQANADSPFAVIGSGGRYVAFSSTASNLVPGDTNGSVDIFVRVT